MLSSNQRGEVSNRCHRERLERANSWSYMLNKSRLTGQHLGTKTHTHTPDSLYRGLLHQHRVRQIATIPAGPMLIAMRCVGFCVVSHDFSRVCDCNGHKHEPCMEYGIWNIPTFFCCSFKSDYIESKRKLVMLHVAQI